MMMMIDAVALPCFSFPFLSLYFLFLLENLVIYLPLTSCPINATYILLVYSLTARERK